MPARGTYLLWAMACVLVAPLASSDDPAEAPHSELVKNVSWYPLEFQRGYDMIVRLDPAPGFVPASVSLVYCRIQGYECASALPVEGDPENGYAAVIKWDEAFFRPDVRQIGLNFTINDGDDQPETSPQAHWPEAPPELPPEAPHFYFVNVQGQQPTADSAAFETLVVLAVLGACAFASRRP